MNPIPRALQSVRQATALAPVRPAYAAGIRAAIATVVPLVVAHVLAAPDAGTWMSLGGFSGALGDRGGPYRTRAATLAVLGLCCAAAALAGTLASAHVASAVAVTFVVALLASLARVWGDAGAAVGGSALSTFVIALAVPSLGWTEPVVRAGFVMLGVLWAMAIALVLWPLRPYRPARLAVAASYRALAAHAYDVADGLARPPRHDRTEPPAGSATVRAALEQARLVLARLRRGRSGETGRGERLVVLGESVDQLFGQVVAIGETVATIPDEACDVTAHATLVAAVDGVGASANALAVAVEAERDVPPVHVDWSGESLRAAVAGLSCAPSPENDEAAAHYLQTAALLDRAAQYARVAAVTVAALNGGRAAAPEGLPAPASDVAEEPDDAPTALATLRAVLTPDSVILRYALRVAVVAAAAVALTESFGIRRGYWVTITVVVILQPYTGATTNRALQRVIGTMVGGILTAALGAIFHDPIAILVLAFVFSAACVALMPLSYAAFSVFLTPTFVLLAEASAGDWHLAGVRVLDTLLGGALALAGARLLWPSPEWRRLPNYMAAALRANREYLDTVLARFGDRGAEAGRAIRAARRRVGLATVNAEESFQRLLGEHAGADGELTSAMTFLTYTRRLTASTAALAFARHAPEAPPPAALARFAADARLLLDDLAASLSEERPPSPLPPFANAEEDPALPPLFRARVQRLRRQMGTLHEAVERWTSRSASVAPAAPRGEPVPA